MPLRFKRFERIRSHFAFRFTRLGVLIFAMVLAVAIVTTLTVDLGPSLRGLAERGGSSYLHRPMHIGTLSIRLLNGKFVLDDRLLLLCLAKCQNSLGLASRERKLLLLGLRR